MDNQNFINKQDLFFEFIRKNKIEEIKEIFEDKNQSPWLYTEEEGFTGLHKAVYMEFPKLVSLLLNLVKKRISQEEFIKWINFKSNIGYTPLHYASYRGNNDVIKLLINNGANIERKNDEGLNVLHMAVQGNRTASLIYFVEKYNLDYMLTDNIGSTPLHWASYVGSEECVLYLITLNPDLNKQDNEGLTPLHLAVSSDRTKIIKKLLYAGADRNIKDKQNRTPYDHAIAKNKKSTADLLIKNNYSFLCTIKLPNQKLEKSNQNIILYLILHVLIEGISFLALLQYYEEKTYFYIILISNIFLFSNFVTLICSDPGQINKNQSTLLQIIEEKLNISDYCFSCIVKKTSSSKHCLICQKCVDKFDHHCYWINNCIGKNNMKFFISFLLLTITNLLFNIIIALNTLCFSKTSENPFPPKILPNIFFTDDLKIILIIIVCFTALLFLVPVSILFFINLKSLCSPKIVSNEKSLSFSYVQNSKNEEEILMNMNNTN